MAADRGESNVRRARVADIPACALVLSRAFVSDPLWQWVQPEPSQCKAGLIAFYMVDLEDTVPFGLSEVADVDGVVKASAIWVEAHTIAGTYDNVYQHAAGFGDGAARFKAAYELIGEHMPTGDEAYLDLLAVDPAAQGTGLGTRLISSAVARFDQMGKDLVLETFNPRNVAFYGQFGFEVETQAPVATRGPTLMVMRRTARP